MSRYLLLSVVVVPIAVFSILSAIVDYKTKALSKKGALLVATLWVAIAVSVAMAELIYNFLFSRNLTITEPMSLFDVVTISSIIVLTSALLRTRTELYKSVQKQSRIIEAMSKIHPPRH